MDALFFFAFILAGLFVLARRGLSWSSVVAQNWPLFLFYAFLLTSVGWANSPFVSFKRWFKEFGNIVMVLVILTEADPLQAIRATFVRCAYWLLPLSVIFIRYFPSMGRFYSGHGGEGEFTGVTMQKNSLGVLVLVTGFIILWDWLSLLREQEKSKAMRMHGWLCIALLLMSVYLLYMCNSQTSILCLLIGGIILASTRLPMLKRNLRLLTVGSVAAVVAFLVLDQLFGLKEHVVATMGRDMTFTGRTDVWRELLALKTDPIFGVGFMSFWDDMQYRSKLPDWIAFSAHNGYVEQYLAGGWLGIFFLAVMLLATLVRVNRELTVGGDYGAVRFAICIITLVANFSESNFACMTPVGFIFLIAAIGFAPGFVTQPATEPEPDFIDIDSTDPESVNPETRHPMPRPADG